MAIPPKAGSYCSNGSLCKAGLVWLQGLYLLFRACSAAAIEDENFVYISPQDRSFFDPPIWPLYTSGGDQATCTIATQCDVTHYRTAHTRSNRHAWGKTSSGCHGARRGGSNGNVDYACHPSQRGRDSRSVDSARRETSGGGDGDGNPIERGLARKEVWRTQAEGGVARIGQRDIDCHVSYCL